MERKGRKIVNELYFDREATAAVVGFAAAQNLFGQGGACIGRTFTLLLPNGKPVRVEMAVHGCRFDSPLTRAQIRALATTGNNEEDQDNGEHELL